MRTATKRGSVGFVHVRAMPFESGVAVNPDGFGKGRLAPGTPAGAATALGGTMTGIGGGTIGAVAELCW